MVVLESPYTHCNNDSQNRGTVGEVSFFLVKPSLSKLHIDARHDVCDPFTDHQQREILPSSRLTGSMADWISSCFSYTTGHRVPVFTSRSHDALSCDSHRSIKPFAAACVIQ